MNLVKPSYEIMAIYGTDSLYDIASKSLIIIEEAGRTCYKSESELTLETARKFVKKLNKLGHHSVLEHSAITVKFIIDRGISHELVRHRLCAFSQESTRYCNYKGGVTFVIPPWVRVKEGIYRDTPKGFQESNSMVWFSHMLESENTYIDLLDRGWSPQQARSVLPNSLKTELVVTTNFREWLHIFNLRCSPKAHPQMREIMVPLRNELSRLIPEVFSNELN